jgi:hypothetical protein
MMLMVISLVISYLCFKCSFLFLPCHISLGGSSGLQAATWSTQPNNEEVVQVRLEIILLVPAGCDSTAYHIDIRDSFSKSYQKERKFYMSVQGLGTGRWHFEGRVMFTNPCRLRRARERIRNILLKCHARLEYSLAENQAFSQYLGQTSNLNVKKDTEPLPEGHHWNLDRSSGEPIAAAQGALLHFLHISPSLRQKLQLLHT